MWAAIPTLPLKLLGATWPHREGEVDGVLALHAPYRPPPPVSLLIT